MDERKLYGSKLCARARVCVCVYVCDTERERERERERGTVTKEMLTGIAVVKMHVHECVREKEREGRDRVW